MRKFRKVSTALTIAGSDSSGGAGIQADLKTFAAFGVHGISAITCVTAQSPDFVGGVQAVTAEFVRQQLECVFDAFQPTGMKTGMLYSTEIIQAVAAFLRGRLGPGLVVDPVMVATSGARLLKTAAIEVLVTELLPIATLVTPNLDEASILIGHKLASVEDLREAARILHRVYGCAALVKGGHLRHYKEAVDIFYDGKRELLLTAPFLRKVNTHGTGCTYSAAIAAGLAKGMSLPSAVQKAKDYITAAIYETQVAGHHQVLGHFGKHR